MSGIITKSERDSGFARIVGRIVNEYLDRRAAGDHVTAHELLASHPELADELREHLEVLGELQPPEARINDLIERGVLQPASDSHYAAELGPYKITGCLGRGGMGMVFKAYEESLDRPVALKILRSELSDDEAAAARFLREARAAAALHHPNIVTIHAFGNHRGVCYIAMEHIDGPTLAEVIREHFCGESDGATKRRSDEATEQTGCANDASVLNTETIRTIFRQILSGLAAAHQAGIIHRDIKPSNILLSGWTATPPSLRRSVAPSLLVKLLDFGLARTLASTTRLTRADATPGTPEYMSPEQARGDADIDHRTDLYSAGVVLYEMLTGRPPFQAESPTAVIHQILHDEPPSPPRLMPNVDPSLASLALGLMAKESQHRLPLESASEALDAGRIVKPVRSRPALNRRAMMAVLAAAPFAGGLWWLLKRRRIITRVELREGNTAVYAYYGDEGEARLFKRFSDNVINAVELIPSAQIVLVGFTAPLRIEAPRVPYDDASTLVAYDADRELLWGRSLLSGLTWPDCPDTPRQWWIVKRIDTIELNGRTMAVVCANDPEEYPTRISLVDPADGQLDSTFWHTGQLAYLWVIPQFFDDVRPAIMAWGTNNKLDGYDDGKMDGEKAYTAWGNVPVAMILDPEELGGLGPPSTHESRGLGIEKASPHAYAYIDLPHGRGALVEAARARARGTRLSYDKLTEGCTRITRAQRASHSKSPLRVFVEQLDGKDQLIDGRSLFVDWDLSFVGVHNAGASVVDYWRDRWHVIIQNGKYVDP